MNVYILCIQTYKGNEKATMIFIASFQFRGGCLKFAWMYHTSAKFKFFIFLKSFFFAKLRG